jgi:hypothetical protein
MLTYRRDTLTDQRAPVTLVAPASPRRLIWWRELALTALLYTAYSAARDLHGREVSPTDYDGAIRNARSVLGVERGMHIGIEHSLQELALHATWLIRLANILYGSAHFVVTMAVLAWLYRYRPARYRRWRVVLFAATAAAVVGFVVFPVAPPRMLPPSYGFVDTLHVLGGLWTFNSGVVERISDPFAAMPSLHICWAVWCAAAIYPALRRRWARALAVAYPIVTAAVVLITGNHYLLDVAAGAAIVGIGMAVAWAYERSWSSVRRPRLRRRVIVELRGRLGDRRRDAPVRPGDGARGGASQLGGA